MKISQKRQFVIPCRMMCDNPEYEGSREWKFYVGQAAQNVHPLHFQADWIMRDRLWYIPVDVMKSIWLLKEIADENNVNFVDLCLYALNYPFQDSKEKPKKVSKKSKALKYDTRISEFEYSNELKRLAKLIFPDRESFALGLFCSLCVENKPEDFLAESYKRISNSKKLIERYEFVTYNSAIILDCFGQLLYPSLYNALVANYYTNFEDYKKYNAKLRKSLQKFAKVKVLEEFKCFDVKKMQKKLLKVC